MTLDECIKILTEHNKWRRGETTLEIDVDYPKNLGGAIDYAVEELHRLKGLEK